LSIYAAKKHTPRQTKAINNTIVHGNQCHNAPWQPFPVHIILSDDEVARKKLVTKPSENAKNTTETSLTSAAGR